MSERGGMLVGLMVAGLIGTIILLIGVFALPRYTDLTGTGAGEETSNPQTPGGLLEQASNVQIQANLKNLQTSIFAYYAEQGVYPTSLNELISYMGLDVDTTNIIYMQCTGYSAYIYHHSEGYPGYVFNYEQTTQSSGSPPSCS